jgi:hypothetical protein
MVLIATFSSEQHGYEYGRRCAAPAKPGEWRLAENQLGKRRLCVKILLTEKITLGISAVIGERWVVPRGQRTSGKDVITRYCKFGRSARSRQNLLSRMKHGGGQGVADGKSGEIDTAAE